MIDDCHIDTKSSIVVNQVQSRWFDVQQGVRQGGVLSTCLYLVFINDLVEEIQMKSNDSGILNIPSSNPTLADDLSLIAIYPRVLQCMLDAAVSYSNRWRFKFNAVVKRSKNDMGFVVRVVSRRSQPIGDRAQTS